MFKKIKFFFLVIPAVLLLTGCGGAGIWQNGKVAEVIESRNALSSSLVAPKNIVLMLPFKGELAESSKAIRNGFLAAYYQSRKQHSDINIKVIDTASGDIQALYQQAVADGAEVIVGPLTKKDVEGLLKIAPLPVPIIALNTLEDYMYNYAPNLYQFGLMPQDEALQAAIKMSQEQYERVAIIAPENSWGEKISSVFKSRLAIQGSGVVAILNYSSEENLSKQVCNFLAQNPEELCEYKKREDRKKDVTSEEVRRQDIDSIFLVASAEKARQLVPLLKFYYADDLPIYSISSIFSGTSKPALDQDINGVYFCDMPWVLKEHGLFNEDLKDVYLKITTLWPSSLAKHKRLYALGIDAYNIASKLNGFLDDARIGVEGASGILYLDEYNHIYRQLEWAQMRQGVPIIQ